MIITPSTSTWLIFATIEYKSNIQSDELKRMEIDFQNFSLSSYLASYHKGGSTLQLVEMNGHHLGRYQGRSCATQKRQKITNLFQLPVAIPQL